MAGVVINNNYYKVLVSEEHAESQECGCHNQHHATSSGSWPGTRNGIHKSLLIENFVHIHYEKPIESVVSPPFSPTEVGWKVLVVGESVGARDAVANGYTEESEA